MTRSQVVKKIMKFLNSTDKLDFEQRLILLRAMRDVKNKINRDEENLDTILLKLRYGVKQGIPKRWKEVIAIPSEIGMAGNFLGEPKVEEEQKKRRPGRTLKFADKVEKENKAQVGAKLIRL
jgi:hypothetical protein